MRVFSANAPSCGPEVLAFEKEFSLFVGVSHAIAVGNATQGLEIAARAAVAMWSGDGSPEIIVPSISWISTASAAALAGATVKFADVSPQTLCADLASIKRLVSPRTAAVIIVHLFGRPADGTSNLAAWLHSRGILLIEDCAHAVGASAAGRLCGSIGDIGVFSFHQQKNMVTLGEGGMCVTSVPKLRELMTGYRSLCAMSYDPKGKYLALDAELHPMGRRYWIMVRHIRCSWPPSPLHLLFWFLARVPAFSLLPFSAPSSPPPSTCSLLSSCVPCSPPQLFRFASSAVPSALFLCIS